MSATGAFIGGRFGSFVESQMHGRNTSSFSSAYSLWVQTAAWGAVAYRVGVKYDASISPSPDELIYPGTLSSLTVPVNAAGDPHDYFVSAGIFFDEIEYNETCWRRCRVDVVSTPDPNTGTGTSQSHWAYTHPRCKGYDPTTLSADQLFSAVSDGTFSSSGSEQHWAMHDGFLDGGGVANPAANDTESGTNGYGESIEKECVSSGSALYVEWRITAAGGTTVYRITWDTPFTFDDFLAEAVVMYGEITIPTGTSSSTTPGRNDALIATADDTYSESGEPIQVYCNESDIPGGGLDSAGFIPRASGGIVFGTNGMSVGISGVRYRFAGEQPAEYVRTCGTDGARDTAESIKLEYFADRELDLVPTAEMLASLTDDYIATQLQFGGLSSYTSTTPDFPAPS